MDHFQIFNTLFTKEQVPEEEISKNFKPFLANRQLMNIEELVFLLNNFNTKDTQLNPVQYYNLLNQCLPKMKKAPFLKFNNKQKKNDDYIKMLAEYYNCSYRVARDYLKFVYLNEKLKEEIEYNHHLKNGSLNEFLKQVEKSKKSKH
jgi:hypothetical protein